jgi:hypothetical protein
MRKLLAGPSSEKVSFQRFGRVSGPALAKLAKVSSIL